MKEIFIGIRALVVMAFLIFIVFKSCQSFGDDFYKYKHTFCITKYKVTENGVSKTMVIETFNKPYLDIDGNFISLRASDKGIISVTKGKIEILEQKEIKRYEDK